MDDQELLELAASAAGVCLHPKDQLRHSYGNWGCDTTCGVCKKDPCSTVWRPLTDDGDALRLAVKLGICIEFLPDAVRCKVPGVEWIGETCLPCDTEYLGVAHRRAIVRAAAEIGRAAQQSKGEHQP